MATEMLLLVVCGGFVLGFYYFLLVRRVFTNNLTRENWVHLPINEQELGENVRTLNFKVCNGASNRVLLDSKK